MPVSQSAFVRTTWLAILIGAAALAGILITNYVLVGRTQTYSNTVNAALQQRLSLSVLRSLLQDAETSQRGFLLTGDPDYLGPYRRAETAIPGQLASVHAVVDASPSEAAKLQRLEPIIAAKMAELKQTIDLFNAGRRDESLALVKTDVGRQFMDRARAAFSEMIDTAESRISRSVEEQRNSTSNLRLVTFVAAFVILIAVSGIAWMIAVYTRQLLAAESEVRDLNLGLEQRVGDRTADLARANDEIQRFAYIVTHDLRAPLVNIMGFTSELELQLSDIQAFVGQLAEDSSDKLIVNARTAALEDLPEALRFIRASTRKMDDLINAILKLSREGRRALKPEPINIKNLLERAAASVQHQVIDAGGEISISGDAPVIVSDRLALEQIFGNLLDNAVKYRALNRPLQVSMRVGSDAEKRTVVDVVDNGRGIAQHDHSRVFDLFRRSGSQDQPGEGIGLAHVRAMVRNLGGEITLQSEFGQGSTFRVSFARDVRKILGAA